MRRLTITRCGFALAALAFACLPAGAQTITYGPPPPPFAPPVVASNFYVPFGGITVSGAPAAPAANLVICHSGALLRPTIITNLAARVTTLHAANNFQLAVYASGAWGRPGALLGATGNLSTAATGIISGAIAGGAITLGAGNYWWCFNTSSGTAVFTAWSSGAMQASLIGATTGANVLNTFILGLSVAQAFGTWPAFTSGTSWTEVTTATVVAAAYQP